MKDLTMKTSNLNLSYNDIQRNVYSGEERPQAVRQRNPRRYPHRVQSFRGDRNYNLAMDNRQAEAQRPCKTAITGAFQDSDKGTISRMIWVLLTIVLGVATFLALFSEPSDASETWYADFFISKAFALIAFIAMRFTYHKASECHA